MDLLSTRFLVLVPLALIVLCSLEESLERRSLRESQILCNLLRLVIELAASVLRIPVRLLVCVRLCKPSALADFNRLAGHVVATMDLRTADEAGLLALACEDGADLQRHDAQMLRVQKRLARALGDASRLRRDNAVLTRRLGDVQAERASILCAVEELAQRAPPAQSSPLCNDNDSPTQRISDRPLGSNENDDALASVHDRFARLAQDLRTQQARYADLERELQAFQEDYRRAHEDRGRAERSHQETKDRLRTLIHSCRTYQQARRRADARRVRTLVVALMVALGLTRQLGVRLARAMHAHARLLARWRAVSAQKVSARRELIKAVCTNHELRERLAVAVARREQGERWQGEYHKSVKAREAAAGRFRVWHAHAAARYTGTVRQLLAGLLVLWRLSLVLTQELAEARVLARALEDSAVAHGKLVEEKARSELKARVARVAATVDAMESVDVAYLRVLFEQTRP